MKKVSVFLSHTWSDKNFARRLASDLNSAGLKVWFDEAEIKVGDSLINKIREGIDSMDFVLVVLDSTKDPLDQVNITILGNLDAREIPFVIIANKVDLKKSRASRVREAFPKYSTVGISAKTGFNTKELYSTLLKTL